MPGLKTTELIGAHTQGHWSNKCLQLGHAETNHQAETCYGAPHGALKKVMTWKWLKQAQEPWQI